MADSKHRDENPKAKKDHHRDEGKEYHRRERAWEVQAKRTICRHWLDGQCQRGKYCGFAHGRYEIGDDVIHTNRGKDYHQKNYYKNYGGGYHYKDQDYYYGEDQGQDYDENEDEEEEERIHPRIPDEDPVNPEVLEQLKEAHMALRTEKRKNKDLRKLLVEKDDEIEWNNKVYTARIEQLESKLKILMEAEDSIERLEDAKVRDIYHQNEGKGGNKRPRKRY